MARTCGAMLNKSGENWHPCLLPDLRGKTFIFSSLKSILYVVSMLLAVRISFSLKAELCCKRFWIKIPGLFIASLRNLGKIVDLSRPQFSYMKQANNSAYFT